MSERMKQRLCMCLLVVGFGLLAAAAWQLSSAVRGRTDASARMAGCIVKWHQQLAAEVPDRYRQRWLDEGDAVPVALLEACAVERRGQ